MSTVTEIETAIGELEVAEKRAVFDYLAAALEAGGVEETFPDLKGLLAAFPEVGVDEDFARRREMPRDRLSS